MPHFSSCCQGADEYLCQVCGRAMCSKCKPSSWRPDITGNQHAGNVCPDCLSKKTERPMGIMEFAAQESGYPLGSQRLRDYMNRYYGNG